MTKKATEKSQRTIQRVLPDLRTLFVVLYQRGIIGLLLIAVALVSLLGLLGINSGGLLIDWWSRLMSQLFGWGSYAVVTAIAVVGALCLAGKRWAPRQGSWHVLGGIEIMFVALLGLVHLFFALGDPWGAAQAGLAGGYIGAVFSSIFRELLGPWPAGIILSALLAWGALTTTGQPLEEWANRLEDGAHQAWVQALAWINSLRARPASKEPEKAPEPATPVLEVVESPEPLAQAESGRVSATPPEHRPTRRIKIDLPPLKLLDLPVNPDVDEADQQHKAEIIEQTLGQFDVPAKVVEVNAGPMVTQFGVEPGYVLRRSQDGAETERKIRVAKIASLSKDLELALATAPIRIEAPVPGRSIVGIEVPNSQVSVVSLRKVMSSPAFRRSRSDLKLALGEGTAGLPVVADLTKMPHLLIAGATGSGKSICINAIAVCLLFQHSPLTFRLVMIDPKRVELARYQGLPHLYGQVESDVERVVSVLRWLVHEMQERYKKLARVGARQLSEYNRHWRVGSQEYMPRIVVLIDELADLMLFAPEEVERAICRLAQMARATGIHLVMATQRPSVDVVTGLIKANFPARIGFAVSSGMDSRVILDAVGAETLLSKGDMLFMAPDASKLTRAQGSFVSDTEMQRTVQYWEEWAIAQEWVPEPCPWEGLVDQPEEPDEDDLLRQAIQIVREQGNASASMLQRLIDEMEELGIVGPAQRGGRPRPILDLGENPGEPR
jgi:S-DNA-T family DNA segregation ATPase FtsK/SpoIIIE